MLHSVLRAVTRLYPLQTPRARLVRLLPNVPADYGPFHARDGIRYAAYPPGGDHIVKNLFWFGDFDRWVGDTLARLTRPGDVVCDIGANIGDTALPLARIVGPTGRVYAFEPLPAIRTCLAQNVAANALENVVVVGIALSDARGELEFDVPDGQPGMAAVLTDAKVGAMRVPTLSFDDWFDEAGRPHVAVCKIDVEGHELAVFRGMANSLASKRVASIVFERHGGADRGDPVIDMLSGFGYRIVQIRKRAFRAAYAKLGETGPGAPTADFVAVLPSSEADRRLGSVTAL